MKRFWIYVGMMALVVAGMAQGKPCPGAATIKDYDGNVYNTVQIGDQCWMRENLRTTSYADGTPILMGTTTSFNTSYRFYVNDDATTVSTYGYLYNWAAVMNGAESSETNPSGVQGICPNGWHVPSSAEWEQLMIYVYGKSEFHCSANPENIAKALADTKGWDESQESCAIGNNLKKNNATGFSILPAGSYTGNSGHYGSYAAFAILWSATEHSKDDTYAYIRYFCWNDPETKWFGFNKSCGFSVRCLRD